jgi:hypothetical protein
MYSKIGKSNPILTYFILQHQIRYFRRNTRTQDSRNWFAIQSQDRTNYSVSNFILKLPYFHINKYATKIAANEITVLREARDTLPPVCGVIAVDGVVLLGGLDSGVEIMVQVVPSPS